MGGWVEGAAGGGTPRQQGVIGERCKLPSGPGVDPQKLPSLEKRVLGRGREKRCE